MQRHTTERLLELMKRNWPEAFTPVSGLIMRLHRLGSLALENARQQVARHGLGFTEFAVLVALRSASPPHQLAPTELYSAILISSGGLTKVMSGLESRGLITRVEHEADRRSRRVRLTPEGRGLVERVMAEVQAADGALLSSGLSPQEMASLIALMRKLLLALEPEGATWEELLVAHQASDAECDVHEVVQNRDRC